MNEEQKRVMYLFLAGCCIAAGILTIIGFILTAGHYIFASPQEQCALSCEKQGMAFMYIEDMISNDSGTSCQCFEKSIVENLSKDIKGDLDGNS